jgi:predicted nucleic acid-binding protein
MSARDGFFDTNILLHLLSSEQIKADQAEALIAGGGVISVQVLNEFVSVATRKLAMRLSEAREILVTVRAICSVAPLSVETHDLGLDLADRYGFSVYDSMIIAAALQAKCQTLYSEDMQHGQRIGGLTIRNPFAVR